MIIDALPPVFEPLLHEECGLDDLIETLDHQRHGAGLATHLSAAKVITEQSERLHHVINSDVGVVYLLPVGRSVPEVSGHRYCLRS